jgi:biopolymer transport protein ExbD
MIKPLIEPTSPVAKINVVPIIDVALVLVIILMVTAPIIAVTNMDIALPPAQTKNLSQAERVTLTVGRNGELAVDDRDIPASQLSSLLRERLAKNQDAVLVVRADMNVPYTTVEALISDARALGAKRIAIATKQRGETR